MKLFLERELFEAYAHAAAGGQALHVCRTAGLVSSSAPACFKNSTEFAHLFDLNRKRLEATARRLGVRVVEVEKPGTPRQHVDLCGKPLRLAKEIAALPEGATVTIETPAADSRAVFRQEYQAEFFK